MRGGCGVPAGVGPGSGGGRTDAPVLLLDEATSALDVATERKVLRNVLQAQAHKTVIVTTHRPSVLNICNRVYQIANRRICTLTQEEIRQKIADF